MRIEPYLYFDGNCEAAFQFYEKALGAKVEMMLRYQDAPETRPEHGDQNDKIMHGRISIDGQVLMASDAPSGHFHQPQGFSISITVDDPVEAESRFKALSDAGKVNMAFGKTFFSLGFGMCVDPFGIPWIVNCPIHD